LLPYQLLTVQDKTLKHCFCHKTAAQSMLSCWLRLLWQ
jgi:hypothetical protein